MQPQDVESASFDTRVFNEAARKSEVGWIDVGADRAQPVWWTWQDNALLVITGGAEQPDPGLAHETEVSVIVRSKETGARLLIAACVAQLVSSDAADWESLATAIHVKRLNSTDDEVARWRKSSQLWRLVPTGRSIEPWSMPSAAHHRQVPAETTATTLGRMPLMLGRKPKRRL